jgi:outer membrane protein assembly factor BamB
MPSGTTQPRRFAGGGVLPFLLLALLCASATPAAAQGAGGPEWPQFRFGPRGLGFNPQETLISPGNVASLERAWSTPIGETIFTSAAVSNGRVYVGTLGGRLLALDAQSGAILWSRPPDALAGDTVWTSPAVANGLVYFAANRPVAVVYALDAATGATVWSAAPLFSIIVSSPVVSDGTLYLAFNDHTILALDAATGATRWTADAGSGMYASPAVAGGRLFVTVHNRGLLALDAQTGVEEWLAPLAGPQWSSPAAGHGRVFVGSRDDERVFAFDARTGAMSWSTPVGAWVHTSPALAGGVVYAGANDGRLHALDAATGQVRWSRQVAPTGGIFGGATVAGGVVYAASGQGDGKVYALDAATGQPLFSSFVGDGDQSGDGEWVNASPTVVGDTVYLGTYEGEDSVVSAFRLPTTP